MMGPSPGRGKRLQAIAERVFDRATLDRMILPAIADLQHECAVEAGRSSRTLIRWRAYWSVWKTFGICLIADGVCNPHGVGATIARRTAVCLAALVPVLIVPGLLEMAFSAGPPVTMSFSVSPRFTVVEALKASLLLLPQALLACLPSAFFLSLVMYRKDERPDGATVVPSVIAGTLGCLILVGLLSAVVVPRANDSYRSFVYETFARSAGSQATPVPPLSARGPSEMTWWELRERIAQAPDHAARSRASARLQERFAFVAVVPVLALLGYGLSNRGRSRRAMFAVALAIQTLYYMCFGLAVANFAKPYLHGPWIVNLAFLLLALSVLRASSASRLSSGI